MAKFPEEVNFTTASADASATYPVQCGSLRKGGMVVLKKHPCKIVEMAVSKPGKHGHAKVHLVGLDLFTAKKYEDICPSGHMMNVPNIVRKQYQLINVSSDGFLSLMDETTGVVRSDVKLPEGTKLGKEILEKFATEQDLLHFVSLLEAMGEEVVAGIKSISD
ncbi:eukaryotic translation initiation factor 5A-2-like [Dysidea avara]|uniref:eukaryotic translation initiation factor 5A-2-like n=1 Tax=Dysidea avara TaxID=196820 RepID=UPI00331E5D80